MYVISLFIFLHSINKAIFKRNKFLTKLSTFFKYLDVGGLSFFFNWVSALFRSPEINDPGTQTDTEEAVESPVEHPQTGLSSSSQRGSDSSNSP